MTREEQEKLGKEIVEKLNKGESVSEWSLSDFYNIKKFYYIKIEEIDSDNFNLISLPIDNEGNSFLEVRFWVYLNIKSIYNININPENNSYFDLISYKYYCFTKFNLTGEIISNCSLDYWLVKNEKFKWILEKLKINDPEYNLAMYELFGFNEEYIRKIKYYG